MPTVRFTGEWSHINITTPPLKIIRPKIKKAYFATAAIEEVEVISDTETQQEIYEVVSGDTLSTIANKKGTTVAAIIESDPVITTENQNTITVGQQITLPTTTSATSKQKKITFTKADNGTLGSDLYVIVETEGFQGYPITINV